MDRGTPGPEEQVGTTSHKAAKAVRCKSLRFRCKKNNVQLLKRTRFKMVKKAMCRPRTQLQRTDMPHRLRTGAWYAPVTVICIHVVAPGPSSAASWISGCVHGLKRACTAAIALPTSPHRNTKHCDRALLNNVVYLCFRKVSWLPTGSTCYTCMPMCMCMTLCTTSMGALGGH